MKTAHALSNPKEWIQCQVTPAIIKTKLQDMALILNYKPSMRHHLRDVHPQGTPFVFRATI
jgi:hypothetical protein